MGGNSVGLLHVRVFFGMDAVALQLRESDVHAEDQGGDQAETLRWRLMARWVRFSERRELFGCKCRR